MRRLIREAVNLLRWAANHCADEALAVRLRACIDELDAIEQA